MNLNESFPVTPQKIKELKERIERLKINLSLVQEQFVRGSGKGGQKINKTNNCVVLIYEPLKISVRNQESRQRSLNRFLALRQLIDKIEMEISPETSQKLKEVARIRKQKKRVARRKVQTSAE